MKFTRLSKREEFIAEKIQEELKNGNLMVIKK